MTKRKLMKLLREAEGWSLRKLAKKMKVAPSQVSRIERGVQKPTLPYLEKFEHVMNVPLPLLVNDKKRDGEPVFRMLEKMLADILRARKKFGRMGHGR